MGKIDILRRCNLFSSFTDVGLTIISGIAEKKRIPPRTPIFVEGMMGDAMYILHSGDVQVLVKDKEGNDNRIGSIEPYEAFGELALLGGGKRLTSVRTATDCLVLEITLKDFSRLQKNKPQACLKLLMAIVNSFGERLDKDRDIWRDLLISQLDK